MHNFYALPFLHSMGHEDELYDQDQWSRVFDIIYTSFKNLLLVSPAIY